jgi:hypothetical protein
MSSPKPLHVFRQGVASLREGAISTINFSGLRDPPVFSPVIPINPSSQDNAKRTPIAALTSERRNRFLFDGRWIGCHFSGRRESVLGSNACVRRVGKDDNPGLARSMDCAAQCCGKNFLRYCNPASRRKPGVCRSVPNPARRIRRARVFHAPRNNNRSIRQWTRDRVAEHE